MSSPTTRMVQAIGEVAGGRILQDLIIYCDSSGQLFLADLIFSACRMQHTLCSHGRGLQVFNYFQTRADPITDQPCDGHHPSSSMGGKDSRVSDSICCTLCCVTVCSWTSIQISEGFWVNLLDSLNLNTSFRSGTRWMPGYVVRMLQRVAKPEALIFLLRIMTSVLGRCGSWVGDVYLPCFSIRLIPHGD